MLGAVVVSTVPAGSASSPSCSDGLGGLSPVLFVMLSSAPSSGRCGPLGHNSVTLNVGITVDET
jgi:hypothetical protein